MQKVIITSTINAPTEAIRLFDAMPDWHLIVIGDKKTPEYSLGRGRYVTPKEQESYDKNLSKAIGWNKFQRLNIGLLMAYDLGAEVVALINDDNTPYDDWGKNLMVGRQVISRFFQTDESAFDPVCVTRHNFKLWHRGFPLELLPGRQYIGGRKNYTAEIQADFWNGDPDVDAICRLEHKPVCEFDLDDFPIASNAWSPFNCQNTFLSRDVIKDYFLYPGIGRQDDIWASYYAQAKGHRVIYGKASVYHDRGARDLIQDMKNEYLGYEMNLNLIYHLKISPDNIKKYVTAEANKAFELYRRHF